MQILSAAYKIFLLHKNDFLDVDFPRWQSILAVSLIGVLIGLDPQLRAEQGDLPAMPLWLLITASVLSMWVVFLVIFAVLRWWLRRGGRWDGAGDLFNLIVASWLLANILGAGLVALGTPILYTLPLGLYSVWVATRALSGAVPKASLGYCLGGIGLSLLSAAVISVEVLSLVFIALGIGAAGVES